MSGKLDHVSKSWNNTERSARKASPPRSAIGRVPYAPKPPAAFTKSWNRPRPSPSARFKPISGPPHRRSCWPSRREVAVPCIATLSTAPTSRVRSPSKTRTATRIYFIYRAVRPLSNRMAMLPGAVAGGRFPHARAHLGRLREGRQPNRLAGDEAAGRSPSPLRGEGVRGRGPVARFHVLLEHLQEVGYDRVAFERDLELAIHVHGGLGLLEGARQRDADVRVLRLPGAVHHAAHHRDAQRFHPGIALAPRDHLLFQVSLDVFGHLLEEGRGGAAAAGACRDLRREAPQAE